MKAEAFVRHVTPFIDRLLVRDPAAGDATTSVRRAVHAPGVIGRGEALAAVLRQVALVAPLNVHVLITGESGTGKSQLARVVHDNGPRASGPFVELNCAALPETLIESELFGCLPGAHSTATRRTEGKVAAAEGGTLFLDEITELAPAAQAKVLHLLQSRQYFPLGGTKPVTANVRIIAGTNADVESAVGEGRLRQDLFYRLHVLPVRLPSLRERREDIPDLVQFFCAAASARHRLPTLEVSRMAMRAAENAEWPGNVRQLANAVEGAAIRAAGAGAARIERTHLFPEDGAPDADSSDDLTFQEATRRFQADFLRDALKSADWNVMDVARRLDLARSHLYTLIHAFGLERHARRR
jgi:Nif-specific regulatory protein